MAHLHSPSHDMTEQLDHGKILPLVFRLTVPAVIAQLITFLYNIVDRMYVAKIPDSGMDALAALGIVLPITLMIQAFANLVGLGGAPRAGFRLGEGNRPEANRIFNTALLLLLTGGAALGVLTFLLARPIVVLFGCPPSAVEFAVSYLKIYACGTGFVMLAQGLNPFIQTEGHSFVAMGSVLIGALTNIALDPLFIFAFGMGGGRLQPCNRALSAAFLRLHSGAFLLPPVSVPVPVSGHASAARAAGKHSLARDYAVCHDDYRMRDSDCF